MKKVWLLIAVVSLPAGAGLLAQLKTDDSPPLRSPASEQVSFVSATTDAFEFDPKAGERYEYDFKRDIVIRGLSKEMPAITYGGRLQIDVIEVSKDGFSALVSEQIIGQPKNSVIIKLLADKRGEKIQIFSRKLELETDRQHESVLKDLLAQLFFSSKVDTVGVFNARFEHLKPENGFRRMKKTKFSYLSGENLPTIVSSEHWLKWNDKYRMPEEVQGAEATKLGAGETSLSSEAGYKIKLAEVMAAAKVKRSLWVSLNEPTSLRALASKQSMRDHPDYVSLSLPDLLNQLRSIEQLSPGEQLKLFGDLVKFLEMNGESLPAFLNALKAGDALRKGADSPLFQAVVGALATVGTPEAQAALRDLYYDPAVPVSGKGSILGSFTTTQAQPDDATRNFLADVMVNESNKDLAYGAGFAFGSALGGLEKSKDASDGVAQILSAWERAKSGNISDQISVLDIMGNSGREEFLPVLSSVIAGSGAPELRAKATFALRYIKTKAATQLLASSLMHPDSYLRTAAVAAIGFATWAEVFRQPIESCSVSETVLAIKSACAKVLESSPRIIAQGN